MTLRRRGRQSRRILNRPRSRFLSSVGRRRRRRGRSSPLFGVRACPSARRSGYRPASRQETPAPRGPPPLRRLRAGAVHRPAPEARRCFIPSVPQADQPTRRGRCADRRGRRGIQRGRAAASSSSSREMGVGSCFHWIVPCAPAPHLRGARNDRIDWPVFAPTLKITARSSAEMTVLTHAGDE